MSRWKMERSLICMVFNEIRIWEYICMKESIVLINANYKARIVAHRIILYNFVVEIICEVAARNI